MKTIIYIFIFLFGIIVSVKSQTQLPSVPYEKTEYVGLNPIWYETCNDSSFITDKMDGYNHFRPGDPLPLIHENKIYTVSNINDSSTPYYGSYLQCRDIETGQLIWQYLVGVRESGHFEVIRLMYIDNNSRLCIISQIRNKMYDPAVNLFFLEDMILSKRIFDADEGELLFSYKRGFDDDEAFKMQFSNNKTAKYSYLFKEDTLLRYIDPIKINDTFYLRSVLLDETGKKVGNESLLKFKYITHYFNLIQFAQDTFMHVEINYADSTLLFRYLSPDLQEYATYTTPKIKSRPEFLEFVKLSADKKKILFEYLDRNDPFFNFVELLVYDSKANLQKRAALDNYSSNYFEVLKWEDDSDEAFTILKPNIVKNENNERVSIMNVSIYDDQNGEFIVNTFKSSNPLRYSAPFLVMPLNDDKYFVQFADIANTSSFNRDPGALAVSQMLLDGKILFLPSNTEDLTIISSVIKAYPNPAIDEFILAFDTEYTGTIQVYSMGGQLLLQKHVSHTQSEQIDILTLDPGMYMVQCIPSDHKISPVTLKLVKM